MANQWPSRDFIHQILNLQHPLQWTLLQRTHTTPSWKIQERLLDDHLIYLIQSGLAEGIWHGNQHALRAGDWVWLEPGVQHSFRNPDPDDLTVVAHMRFQLLTPPQPLAAGGAPVRYLHGAHHLSRLWDEMLTEFEIGCDLREERLRGQLASLLIEAGRLANNEYPRGLSVAQAQAMTHLAEQRHYQLAPSGLAKAAGLSPEYFSRLFRRTYRTAPRQWLVQKRLERGAYLLRESTGNISEIARQLGYPDVFQFSRRFKKVYGMSPQAYRRRAENR